MICHMELRELKSERLVLRKVRREVGETDYDADLLNLYL